MRDALLGIGLIVGGIAVAAVIVALVLSLVLHVDPWLGLFPPRTHPAETVAPAEP